MSRESGSTPSMRPCMASACAVAASSEESPSRESPWSCVASWIAVSAARLFSESRAITPSALETRSLACSAVRGVAAEPPASAAVTASAKPPQQRLARTISQTRSKAPRGGWLSSGADGVLEACLAEAYPRHIIFRNILRVS